MSETPSQPKSPYALEVRNLTRSFGTRKILQDISFQLKHGEILIIMGGSGCGKSTLLRHIIGSLKPDSGEIYIHGTEITRLDDEGMSKIRKRFGMLFQTGALFNSLTVGENVALPILESSDVAPNIAELVVKLKLELVGLTGFEQAYPTELSGGMKQRLEVARALAVNPDVLFLDEPFGALDSITRLTMRSELLRIWEAERNTIIFVTHDIDEAVQLADRVAVMSNRPGRIQQIVDIDIPHPRDIDSQRYLELRAGIYRQIGLAHRI